MRNTNSIYVLNKPTKSNAIQIDLSDEKFSEINPFKINKIPINETMVVCDCFPTGLFPGARKVANNLQSTQLNHFANYYEFSKIMEDEVTCIDGDDYLNRKFFERRKDGWEGFLKLSKNGKLKGFFIDGGVYHAEEEEVIKEFIFKNCYKLVIQDRPIFKTILKDYARTNLFLTGLEEYYLNALKEIIEEAEI